MAAATVVKATVSSKLKNSVRTFLPRDDWRWIGVRLTVDDDAVTKYDWRVSRFHFPTRRNYTTRTTQRHQRRYTEARIINLSNQSNGISQVKSSQVKLPLIKTSDNRTSISIAQVVFFAYHQSVLFQESSLVLIIRNIAPKRTKRWINHWAVNKTVVKLSSEVKCFSCFMNVLESASSRMLA